MFGKKKGSPPPDHFVFKEIDWDKVQTIDDIKTLLRAQLGNEVYGSYPSILEPYIKTTVIKRLGT